jgi:hypothetical protein
MSAETDTQAAEAANSLGVTPEYIKRKLIEKLEAEYVDVEDMSGIGALAASCSLLQSTEAVRRWLWPGFRSYHCLAAVCQENEPCAASVGQYRTES